MPASTSYEPLSDDGSETLHPDALRRLVVDLSQQLGTLEAQVAELGDQLEKAETARAALQAENQDLRHEIAPAEEPAALDFLVRELATSAELVRYRRERWLTPKGKTIITHFFWKSFWAAVAPTCTGSASRSMPQRWVTTEQLTAILNGIGMDISKRPVVRILTSGLENFAAEDQSILRAGLATTSCISVDDTVPDMLAAPAAPRRSAAAGSACSARAARSHG